MKNILGVVLALLIAGTMSARADDHQNYLVGRAMTDVTGPAFGV